MPDEDLSRYLMTEAEAEAILREGITLESVLKEIEIKYGLKGPANNGPLEENNTDVDPEGNHSN